jgi:hypothetical protein
MKGTTKNGNDKVISVNARIINEGMELAKAQGLNMTCVCGRHNDTVLGEINGGFTNGARYDRHGKQVRKTAKNALMPNEAVEGNSKLLKARTERVIRSLAQWVQQGYFTDRQMKSIVKAYVLKGKLSKDALKVRSFA